MTTSRFKAYGALAGMFVLGAVSSAAAYHAVIRRDDARFFSGDREAFESRLVAALERELDLDGEQVVRIRGIFQKHAAEHRRLRRLEQETCGGPRNELRERVDAEIRAVLDPEQRARFETLRAERHRRLFGDRDPHPRASK